ncbi:SIR2 family protein [Leuconostoc gasicomitatum]|uniref:SIR2 family protein n=2 Tax=Leuconostoc gasicomitatum TaxID=115778 RepID=UPI001CC78AC0|nr:SIR2 family protein [Leuconostoc gasicomitatum]MBZ5969743.1 SIR2 family protein [Leuconostoc gasicomitatum]
MISPETKVKVMLMSEDVFFVSNQNRYSKSIDVFKKNGVNIKNGEHLINENEFKNLIKSEVSNFVNQSFDNIVILVGAGASVTNNQFDLDDNGIATSGVTVAKIADDILKELRDEKYTLSSGEELDVFKLEEVSKISQYNFFEKNVQTNEILKDGQTLKSGFNLEDLLSNLFAYKKFVDKANKEKINNTTNAILDIIKKSTSYDYDENIFNHRGFLNVVSKLGKSENKINIVTTNYDTLLEDAAESMKATVFDGFSFSQTPQFDSTMFDWNLVKNVSNIKTHEIVYKQQVFNLLKIHGSLTWERSQSSDNITRKRKDSVKFPVMVFPSSDKYAQSYEEPYFDLFTKFQELLKIPNTLFITTGFSFSDNHISKMILSAIKTNDSLASLLTDFNIEPEEPNENWKKLMKALHDHYQVAFLKATMNGNLVDYLGAKPDEN